MIPVFDSGTLVFWSDFEQGWRWIFFFIGPVAEDRDVEKLGCNEKRQRKP